MFSFLCIVKQKKFQSNPKFFEFFFFFQKTLSKFSGPPRYVLWWWGGICHQPDTFIQIGSCHTVHRYEAKTNCVFLKKNQNGRLKKTEFFKIANSQKLFVKISWIVSWVSRIDWSERHWCSSTYMVVRLSDVSAKTA